MKYTERLKLLIATDIMFIAVLTSLFILAEKDLLHNFGLVLLIILLVGGTCVAASFYAERGECRKWRRIWKDPTWQLAVYIILAIASLADSHINRFYLTTGAYLSAHKGFDIVTPDVNTGDEERRLDLDKMVTSLYDGHWTAPRGVSFGSQR